MGSLYFGTFSGVDANKFLNRIIFGFCLFGRNALLPFQKCPSISLYKMPLFKMPFFKKGILNKGILSRDIGGLF